MENKTEIYQAIALKCFNSDISFTGNGYEYPPMFLWRGIAPKIIENSWKHYSVEGNFSYPGLYVHIPFCLSKCNFCEFFSTPLSRPGEIDSYLDLLEQESRIYARYLSKIKFRTLYFGGGTPSVLNERQLERIFRQIIYKYFDLRNAVQIAFEAGPSTLTRNKIKILKKFGVNRLTLGVQSLDERVIVLSNRNQKKEQVFRSFADAKEEGIDCINIDLMAGLPGQTFGSFKRSFVDVLKLKPDLVHVSPFHPSSPTGFNKSGRAVSNDDIELTHKMIRYASKTLCDLEESNGKEGKEYDLPFSNFYARNVQLIDQIQFNSTYLGIGAGSSSHVTGYARYVNFMDVKKYCKALSAGRLPIYKGCRVSRMDEMIYYITVNLRKPGVNKRLFKKLFNADPEIIFKKELQYLEEKGLVKNTPDYIMPLSKSSTIFLIFTKIFYDNNVLSRCLKKIKCTIV